MKAFQPIITVNKAIIGFFAGFVLFFIFGLAMVINASLIIEVSESYEGK
jgi:hypothetical protein